MDLACRVLRPPRRGTPGSPASVYEIILNVVDGGMPAQRAIEAPRFLIGRDPLDPAVSRTQMEDRFPRPVLEDLTARGHRFPKIGRKARCATGTPPPSSSTHRKRKCRAAPSPAAHTQAPPRGRDRLQPAWVQRWRPASAGLGSGVAAGFSRPDNSQRYTAALDVERRLMLANIWRSSSGRSAMSSNRSSLVDAQGEPRSRDGPIHSDFVARQRAERSDDVTCLCRSPFRLFQPHFARQDQPRRRRRRRREQLCACLHLDGVSDRGKLRVSSAGSWEKLGTRWSARTFSTAVTPSPAALQVARGSGRFDRSPAQCLRAGRHFREQAANQLRVVGQQRT